MRRSCACSSLPGVRVRVVKRATSAARCHPPDGRRRGPLLRLAGRLGRRWTEAIALRGELPAVSAELPLRGEHNALNLCAALSALEALGIAARRCPTRWPASAAPHRLETVAERDGVVWVDDSISTTPGVGGRRARELPRPRDRADRRRPGPRARTTGSSHVRWPTAGRRDRCAVDRCAPRRRRPRRGPAGRARAVRRRRPGARRSRSRARWPLRARSCCSPPRRRATTTTATSRSAASPSASWCVAAERRRLVARCCFEMCRWAAPRSPRPARRASAAARRRFASAAARFSSLTASQISSR